MHRPCVVLAKGAGQILVTELSARLIDADELELARPFVLDRPGWSRGAVNAGRRRQGRTQGDGADEDVDEPHTGSSVPSKFCLHLPH